MDKQCAFQINIIDNVATSLEEIEVGDTTLFGETPKDNIQAIEKIPSGHKIAVTNINAGENIIKYGVVIGRSIKDIPKGSWVHLHVMKSLYDTRSEHLDTLTGAPKDTKYE